MVVIKSAFKLLSILRIGTLSGVAVPLVQVRSDGMVSRHTLQLEEIMKSLTWFDAPSNRHKTLPLRDLRLFLPSQSRPKKGADSPSHNGAGLQGSPGSLGKEIGLCAIMPRPKAKCYLLDLGALKLLCMSKRVEVLYTDSSNRRQSVNQFVDELCASIALNRKEAKSDCESSLSFELQVLEAALTTIVNKFYKQLALVEPILDGLVSDTISLPTEIKVGRLAALKKSLFAYNQGVQSITNAIKELLSNNRDMADMYLRHVPREEDEHEEVEFLLEAYVADLVDIEMEAVGMIAQIEDTMELISLHLNSQRNRIIKLSLVMEMLAVTAASGAVVGSIFGMNLTSGFEQSPSAFYWVTGGCTALMASILTGFLLRFRHLVVARPAGVEHQHSAMKHFFTYIDDIESRVRLAESISRPEFETIVSSVIGGSVDPKEIDLFFRVLDGNRNNRIEASELPPLPVSRSKMNLHQVGPAPPSEPKTMA